MTESGQLAITIPLCLGVIVSHFRDGLGEQHEWRALQSWRSPLLAATFTACLTLLGFQSDLSLPPIALTILIAIAGAYLVTTWQRLRALPEGTMRQQLALISLCLPLLICAILVNLKRGPWLGVLVGTVCFLLMYARRLVLPLACGAIVLALSITPIRERLLASYDHFTIAGGRSTIWRIGAELTSEYPLGIGYHNSGILREFAPEIPAELKHFHNNLLNIAAETGWLGVLVCLWLLIAIVRSCLRERSSPLYIALGCAVISWQVAGLVEYNFGDSEVTILIWILLGLLFQRDLNPKNGSHGAESIA
jgi:O-antigen ligase